MVKGRWSCRRVDCRTDHVDYNSCVASSWKRSWAILHSLRVLLTLLLANILDMPVIQHRLGSPIIYHRQSFFWESKSLLFTLPSLRPSPPCNCEFTTHDRWCPVEPTCNKQLCNPRLILRHIHTRDNPTLQLSHHFIGCIDNHVEQFICLRLLFPNGKCCRLGEAIKLIFNIFKILH